MSLGGVHATAVLTDSTTLSFAVPVVSAGLEDLVVQNPDGASYTLQNALTVQ